MNIEYYHYCNAPFNLPCHSLCTVLVPVCSCHVTNCVLYVFSIGNGLRRHWPPTDAASQFLLNQYYCYWAPATRHHGAMFTNLQCGASSSATFTNLYCVPSSSATFTNLHSAPSTSAPFTNLQCVPRQVRHSLISTVHLL